jgi:hypothetical protein
VRIDCVFFDYDGVLTTRATGSTTTCRYSSERTGIPVARVRQAFARHNRALTLGQVDHEDFPCRRKARTVLRVSMQFRNFRHHRAPARPQDRG